MPSAPGSAAVADVVAGLFDVVWVDPDGRALVVPVATGPSLGSSLPPRLTATRTTASTNTTAAAITPPMIHGPLLLSLGGWPYGGFVIGGAFHGPG
ncbi:hypothetical protein G155_00003 [Mycobacterium sp. VKM Ac-1817D]|nr:hypothetical protein G155_00003 [Mycobacterium sp. VKM Ac-1817D]